MNDNTVQVITRPQPAEELHVSLRQAQDRLLSLAFQREAELHALRESEERFRTAFDSAAIGMALVGLDGRWLQVNSALCLMVGYSETELLERTFQQITHPDDLGADLERLGQLVAGDIVSYDREKRYFHQNGSIVWAMLTIALVRDALGKPRYFIAQVQDISARKAAEEILRRQATLLDLAHDAVIVLDTDYRITYWNPGAEETYGWSSAEAVGRNVHDLLQSEFPDGVDAAHEQLLETGRWEGELRHTTSGGWQIITLSRHAVVRDERGTPVAILEINRDITERKAVEQQLAWLAMHDDATGLPNRHLFLDRIGSALASARRHQGAIAILFIDLDDFKPVNDTQGHAAGDALLAAVARRIEGCLREEDTAARIGGDEFAVLLREVHDLTGAKLVADRLRASLATPFIVLDGISVCISSSIGIALSDADQHDTTPEDLLRRADHAMYQAKHGGKNRIATSEG
jgi:diguanylate cyclase (GGDEF)-like protein/PAS domain S-box-containing protein